MPDEMECCVCWKKANAPGLLRRRRLVLPGLGCPARIYSTLGPVASYDPGLTLDDNAAAIARGLTEPTVLIGHSMGGLVASLVGGSHPVVNIEGLAGEPSQATRQLAAGAEPTSASPLWRALLDECDPARTRAMAGHYVAWLQGQSALARWRQVDGPRLYVYGIESTADWVHLRMGVADRIGIAGAGHFPMVDRPDALDAVVSAFEHALV